MESRLKGRLLAIGECMVEFESFMIGYFQFKRILVLQLIFLKNNFIKEKERCLCSGCGILSGWLKVI